jgi:hypothetical protein
MRASLPHTLRERRRSRAGRHRRAASVAVAEASRPAPPALVCAPPVSIAHAVDPAAQRVRDAGGPIDEASYACHCGFVFRAPVSTTVVCPHCRATQAW